jgi:hypothetical protein
METMHDTGRRFLAGVQGRAGGNVPDLLETTTRSTLRALGGQLSHTPGAVATALGDDLAAELDAGRKRRALAPEELVAAVAKESRVRPAVALELVESVIAELAARIGPAGRDELRRILEPAWVALVVDPRPESADAHAPAPPRQVGAARTLAAARPRGDTLATGKPGSKHPVSESD